MKELVRVAEIQIGSDKVNAVDARELHTFLKVGKDFSTWIKSRIDQYNFVENIDYIVLTTKHSNQQGGRNKKDYHVSLEMAKALCTIESNDKGKQLLKEIVSKSVLTLNEMMAFAKNIDIDDVEMFIYAILEEDTGNIKIGISKNPEQRLKQLQIGNSSQLSIIKTIEAKNNFKDEKVLHFKNKEHLLRGEWFSNQASV